MGNSLHNQGPEAVTADPSHGMFDIRVFALWLCGDFFLRMLVKRFLTPKWMSEYDAWKWAKATYSFVNVSALGSGALYCLYDTPHLLTDPLNALVNMRSHATSMALSTCLAYHIEDTVDVFFEPRYSKKSRYRYMAHHLAVCLGFGCIGLSGSYAGFAVAASTAELNTAFLSVRIGLQCLGVKKTDAAYRANNWCLLLTLVAFRVVPWCLVMVAITSGIGRFPLPICIGFWTVGAVFGTENYTLFKELKQIMAQTGVDCTWD